MKTHYLKFAPLGASRILSVVALSLVVFTASCESFLKVDLPASQLTATAVFEDEQTATAALLGVYADMRAAGILSNLYYQMSLYSDDLDYYGSASSAEEQFYTNSLIPSHPTVSSWWNASYSQIYAANAVLEGLETSDFNEAFTNQLEGEALLVRGLVHFYLSALYGDVPYVRTADYQQNTTVGKTPAAQVQEDALVDLSRAASLLPWEYATADRTRPNKGAALGFLARVALYAGDWQQALDAANLLINRSDLYVWQNDLNQVFLKESESTLWQWYPAFSNRNTTEASVLGFTTAPPPRVALTPGLVSSFDPVDARLSNWINPVSNASDTFYQAYKYQTRSNTPVAVEYSIVMRLAEVYLIRSEAYARLDQLGLAAQDLNKVRGRAGLIDVAYTEKEGLIDQILIERRHELFTEAGHRFFDLKRTHQLDAVLSPLKVGWKSTDERLPLPESELLINPNLAPQNPGYQSEN